MANSIKINSLDVDVAIILFLLLLLQNSIQSKVWTNLIPCSYFINEFELLRSNNRPTSNLVTHFYETTFYVFGVQGREEGWRGDNKFSSFFLRIASAQRWEWIQHLLSVVYHQQSKLILLLPFWNEKHVFLCLYTCRKCLCGLNKRQHYINILLIPQNGMLNGSCHFVFYDHCACSCCFVPVPVDLEFWKINIIKSWKKLSAVNFIWRK